MTTQTQNERQTEIQIDPMFTDRWSPRSFSNDPIPEETILSLFEAARWAPSCYNEQPWLFLYSTKNRPDYPDFLSLLVDTNQDWAKSAPVLLFVLTANNFNKSGKPNKWAQFDAGSAWISLAFQARKSGLYAHAMAGFHRDKAYDVLNVDKDQYTILAAVAIGKRGEPDNLPDNFREIEHPNTRKPLKNCFKAGTL